MSNPMITVVVPCYNYGRFVGETLESILQQSYTDWECIVIDDGSTDNTREVVEPYAAKYENIIYHYQKNGGLPNARNAGIRLAKGKYLQFLDADDLLESRKFERQMDCFKANPNLDLVYSGLRYFQNETPEKLIYSSSVFNSPWTLDKSGNGKDLLKYLIVSCSIMPPMPLIKKESVLRIGAFKEGMKSCEDWEFWLRCAYNNFQFQYIDEAGLRSKMRLHPSSMTRNRMVLVANMIIVRELLDEKLEDENLRKLNKAYMVNDVIEMGLVKQEFEDKTIGKNYMLAKAKQLPSWRLSAFQSLASVLSYSANIFLIDLVRSIMKKYHYRTL